MRLVLTIASSYNPESKVLINENWTRMFPAPDGGTFIAFSDTAEYSDVIHVKEPFDEICDAVKASRRFSGNGLKTDNPVPDV